MKIYLVLEYNRGYAGEEFTEFVSIHLNKSAAEKEAKETDIDSRYVVEYETRESEEGNKLYLVLEYSRGYAGEEYTEFVSINLNKSVAEKEAKETGRFVVEYEVRESEEGNKLYKVELTEVE